MGGRHGCGHDELYYIHAKHMYNLDWMKYRGLKMPLTVFSAFSIGIAIPVNATYFQQRRQPLRSLSCYAMFAMIGCGWT